MARRGFPPWIPKDVSRKPSHLHSKEFKWVLTIWIYSQFKNISRLFSWMDIEKFEWIGLWPLQIGYFIISMSLIYKFRRKVYKNHLMLIFLSVVCMKAIKCQNLQLAHRFCCGLMENFPFHRWPSVSHFSHIQHFPLIISMRYYSLIFACCFGMLLKVPITHWFPFRL